MLVKLGSSSPSRGENKKKHLKPRSREAGKNMGCVFKISRNSKLAKQISNSKNLEQIWIGCLSPKIMAQLLIGFPLKILPFPVSFAGVFFTVENVNFGSWSRNIAVIGLSKDKMSRMFVFSEKPTTDHQNSNIPLEHTRGYPQNTNIERISIIKPGS